MTGARAFPFLDAPRPLAFAHRGGAAEGDENTVAAFGHAVALGFRYLETDVHATADGVPVVFHDPTLARIAGRADRIDTLRWADLSTIRLGGAAVMPRLDEVLDAWPETRFNIDVKADTGVAPTVEAVRRAGSVDRVLLASFDDARLTRIRALAGPRQATSLGMRAAVRLKAASKVGLPLRFPASAVAAQVPPRHGRVTVVDTRFLKLCRRLGLQVHVWTIDDADEMNRLLDLGVDGIMTDRPELLRSVLMTRSQWSSK